MKNRASNTLGLIIMIIGIVLIMISTGCTTNTYYEIRSNSEIPDSSRADYQKMVTTLIKTSNTGSLSGKSKDFGQIVQSCEQVAKRTYEVQSDGLYRYTQEPGGYVNDRTFIHPRDFDESEQIIFNYCKRFGAISMRKGIDQENYINKLKGKLED